MVSPLSPLVAAQMGAAVGAMAMLRGGLSPGLSSLLSGCAGSYPWPGSVGLGPLAMQPQQLMAAMYGRGPGQLAQLWGGAGFQSLGPAAQANLQQAVIWALLAHCQRVMAQRGAVGGLPGAPPQAGDASYPPAIPTRAARSACSAPADGTAPSPASGTAPASGPASVAPASPSSAAGGTPMRDITQRLDPEHNAQFLPHDGSTYCNLYTQAVMRERGVKDFPQATANGTAAWMHDQGAAHGWRKVSGAEAQSFVNQGGVGVAVRENPCGHGHVAPIIEGEAQDGSPMISNAGSNNFNAGSASRSAAFRQAGTEYWVHDGPAGSGHGRGGDSTCAKPSGIASDPTAPAEPPAKGTNRPPPAGCSAVRGRVPEGVGAKANELLHSNDVPLGSHVPVTIDGKDYVLAVEWHKHAATDNVKDSLKQWHRGVTVYERGAAA
jgi:hypothetical protein